MYVPRQKSNNRPTRIGTQLSQSQQIGRNGNVALLILQSLINDWLSTKHVPVNAFCPSNSVGWSFRASIPIAVSVEL